MKAHGTGTWSTPGLSASNSFAIHNMISARGQYDSFFVSQEKATYRQKMAVDTFRTFSHIPICGHSAHLKPIPGQLVPLDFQDGVGSFDRVDFFFHCLTGRGGGEGIFLPSPLWVRFPFWEKISENQRWFFFSSSLQWQFFLVWKLLTPLEI